MERWLAAVLLAPLVVIGAWPGPWLVPLGVTGRAVIDAAMLRRCAAAELGVTAPRVVPDEPVEGCAQPMRALEQRMQEEAG